MCLSKVAKEKPRMQKWQRKEIQAKRAIEDQGFVVHDANVLFGTNCPNIDLVVYARTGAIYVQVKSSEKPAGKNSVVVDGSPWNTEQLLGNAPIYNKHDHYQAHFVVIVDRLKTGATEFYIAPPAALEELSRKRASEYANRPKRDGTQRSIKFRKELPREALQPWLRAWHLLGHPPFTSSQPSEY